MFCYFFLRVNRIDKIDIWFYIYYRFNVCYKIRLLLSKFYFYFIIKDY